MLIMDLISKLGLSRWKNWPYVAVITTISAILMAVVDSDSLTIPVGLIIIFFGFYTSKLAVQTLYENFPKYLEIKFLRYFLIVILAMFIISLFSGSMGGLSFGGH